MTRLREPPWFEELSPQLLRNKAIRTFLQAYSDHEWPEVTKLVLLYGIVSLTRQYPGQILPVAALRDALSAGASAQAVEGAIPELQDRLNELKLQLDDVHDDLQPRGEVSHFGQTMKLDYHTVTNGVTNKQIECLLYSFVMCRQKPAGPKCQVN